MLTDGTSGFGAMGGSSAGSLGGNMGPSSAGSVGGGAMGGDTRTGSADALAAAAAACKAVSSQSGLYDCAGRADAIAAQG